jgi:cytochrome c553
MLLFLASWASPLLALDITPVWNEIKGEKLLALKLKGEAGRGEEAFVTCQGCHRRGATGSPSGLYPRLAGQHATVLIEQMADIRSGKRRNPRMEPFADEHVITPQEIADIAAYLQALPLPANLGKGPGTALVRGKDIYVRDCASCHGDRGEGNGAKFYPLVAGQHFVYLLREARFIRDGERGNANPDMIRVIKPYSDDDLEAVADYMSRLDHAGTKPRRADFGQAPQSVLWVGNSFFYYNNSMHNHFGRLVSSAGSGSRVRSTSATISGSGLDWHDLESLLRPDGLGRYSFIGDNEIRFNKAGRQYDTAIMMDCSQCPIHPQLQAVFHETVRKHAQTLLRGGVRPVLFMSWAYKDKPEMTAQLAEQYTLAANANDALVIPAGLAFARTIAKRGDIDLYEKDKRHPSLAGTYLAACTVYASLFRKSPVGLSYTAGLQPEIATLLQTAAWETVQEYFKP